MKAYEKLPTFVEIDGVRYAFDASFKVILLCFDIAQDSDMEEIEKLLTIYDCLFKKSAKFKCRKKDAFFRINLVNEAFKLLIEKSSKKDNRKLIDFEDDFKYIYAGFMQCYGIDLFSCNLHWWKFISLFNGMSNDTRIMQIIDIRQRPIPKPTKYNAEERAQLIKLKAEFAVKMTQEEREQQFMQSMNSLFDKLVQMAEKR